MGVGVGAGVLYAPGGSWPIVVVGALALPPEHAVNKALAIKANAVVVRRERISSHSRKFCYAFS